jgi:hypothetical protein
MVAAVQLKYLVVKMNGMQIIAIILPLHHLFLAWGFFFSGNEMTVPSDGWGKRRRDGGSEYVDGWMGGRGSIAGTLYGVPSNTMSRRGSGLLLAAQ